MPAVKAAPAPAPPPATKAPSTRVTRSRRPVTTTTTTATATTAADADALASQLDRVLKVGQPKAVAPAASSSKLATTAAAKRAPAKPTSRTAEPRTRTASISVKKTDSAPPTATSASARRTATRVPASATTTAAKGKSKAAAVPEPAPKYPWSVPGDMAARDRALAAQAAVKEAGQILGDALKKGFKYGVAKTETAAAVDEAVCSGSAGLGVVRELFCGPAAKGSQGVGIEKAAFNLALQCLLLDMNKHALDVLVESKPWVLKLYPHDTLDEVPQSAGPKGKKPAPDFSRLAVFPAPTGDVDEAVRVIVCSFALSAWCCLLALGKVDPASVQTLIPFPSPDSDPFNPVNLAPSLPPSSISSLAVLICRRVSSLAVTPGSAEWFHVRRVSAFLLAICVSRNQAKPNLPDKVWDSVGRTTQVYLQERNDDTARREIAAFIDRTVDIVETIAKTRKEQRGEWFTGSWPEVADMWIGIGRTLGDSAIIDKALTCMTAGITIGSSSIVSSASSRSSGASTPTSTPDVPPTPKSAKASHRAIADLACSSARLAKALVEVEALSKQDQPASKALEEVLAPTDVSSILEPLCALEDSPANLPAATSAIRAVERLRRSVIKLLDRPTAMSAARQWLEEVFNVVEAILTRVKAPSLVRSVARDGLPGLVDSTSSLLRICDVTASGQSAIDLIDRAYAVWEACSEHFETAPRVQYGAFLIQSAHGVAHRFSRANMYAESRDLCQRACDWTIALRGILPSDPEEMAKLKSWEAAESALPRRFELLGFSLASDQLNDKAKAIEAYVLGLVNLPKATVHKIDSGATAQSLSTTFTELADAAALFKRISTLLTGEEAVEGSISAIVKAAMDSRQQSASFRGAIIEQLVDTIDHAQFRPHVQETIVALCDLLLEMYDSAYPIRRMRVLLRLMNLVVSTGAVADRFSSLAEEVASLASKDPANDVQLKPFKFEYQSSALILAALNKYHDEVEPSAAVATLGGEAIEVIRAVVLPPINEAEFPAATGKRPVSSTQRRGAVKTPPSRPAPAGRTRAASKPTLPARRGTASKSDAKTAVTPTAVVIDNASRFSQLLGSLASLFGLLGLVLPRLEALKILRAVLRTCDGMSDALVHTSGLLASEYARLGKFSRASQVFVQALKQTAEAKSPVSAGSRADFRLRHARFLASIGHIQQAKDEYREAERLMKEIPKSSGGTLTARYVELCATSERIALAHGAMAAIRMAESDVTTAIESLNIAYRLWCRAAAGISRIAASASDTTEVAPTVEAESPAASTDSKKQSKQPFCLTGKHLGGLQWYYALGVFEATLELVIALAQRGTVKESEYYLGQAKGMVPAIRSTALDARVSAQTAALEARKAKFESSADNLRHASEVLAVNDGPDAIELKRLRGELYSRQQAAPEAEEFFSKAIDALTNLDEEFKTAEAHTTSPKKEIKSPIKEPLLPRALGGILRQRAWILREAGEVEEYQNVMQQLELVSKAAGEKPEQMFLDARVAMSEAFNHFKTDLFMSSLTESTIAMTIVTPDKRAKDRQSTRHGANVLLERAVEAFRATLASDGRIGRVEHVRQACVSLAVLGAYQTSLGQGSPAITSMAADILASVSSITLQRELLPAIKSKFPGSSPDDLDWPSLEPVTVPVAADATSAFWKSLAAKEVGSAFLDTQHDLSSLPPTWSVVSITVTDDRNTMLVSRHQNGFDPLVFCIPLDRQGRREGEEESELFTFDAGINEMKAIMDGNDASIKSISECKTMEDRKAWWKERYALDTRLGELLATIEFCWLGAFKTVLNPRPIIDAAAFAAFRDRLDLIFQTALSSAGSDTRRGARVRLNDTLLTCFATLSSKCKDEEVEDLVYFVLDQYQFHGIAVALAELDFDQIGVDVKSALADLEAAAGDMSASKKEHLLLALDKNVQGIPWESLPILRGRAVSRIPSLPFLLDQVALGLHLGQPADKRTFDATKTTFFMNPGGDLTGTEGRFKDALDALEKKGWKGLRGRAPSEAEMEAALKESELVMYFGHGGGEEYIRGYKVRALPQCAVTMLWGCSSGLLRDNGDFDRTGTPYDYVLAGSPCLVANLWDVTDKDIDRVTVQVMDLLGLDATKLGEARGERISVVQAVSAARSVAKLQFLTGAATVVYGIPVYIQ